jgi:hypothetical protein
LPVFGVEDDQDDPEDATQRVQLPDIVLWRIDDER